MKQKINPFTGKQEYRCNYQEAADHVFMTVGELKYRYTDACTMHESSIPKRTYLHGIAGFWLSDLEHYKKNNIGLVKVYKKKVAEKIATAEVIDLSKKKRS
tara:strand:+ start:1495 stop:1797 length:303 start_codon:yes stop_codon:yes gene_type:complete